MDTRLTLQRIPTPLYTVGHFLAKFELIAAALTWYGVAVTFWGMKPETRNLVGALVWMYLPFLSYIPYQTNKEHHRLISHFLPFFYQPLIYIPTLLTALYGWHVAFPTGSSFQAYALLFIAVSLSHFVMAAMSSPRGIPLYPFPYHLSLHEGFSLLDESDLARCDEKFVWEYEAKHVRSPWHRSWREELEQRPSQITWFRTIWLLQAITFTYWLHTLVIG